jgi:hypothetical protein
MSDTTTDANPNPLGYEPVEGEISLNQILSSDYVQPTPLPFLTSDSMFFNGGTHLIAGQAKGGKSTVLRMSTYQWALDGHKVLVLSEEFDATWQMQTRLLGMEVSDFHYQVVPSLGADLNLLLRRACDGPEDIIVVDTINDIFGAPDMRQTHIIGPILKQWCREITGLRKKTLIFSGYTNKSSKDTATGAQSLLGMVETLITYSRVNVSDEADPNRLVIVRSRNLDSITKFIVEKTPQGFVIKEADGDATLTHDQEEIYLLLVDAMDAGMTYAALCEASTFSKAKVRRLLADLEARDLAKNSTGMAKGGKGGSVEAVWVAVTEEEEG